MLRALRKYIQMVVVEVASNPAAPQQLIEPDAGSKEEKEEVEEMSVAANISGPILPLGMSADGSGKRKKKKATWK